MLTQSCIQCYFDNLWLDSPHTKKNAIFHIQQSRLFPEWIIIKEKYKKKSNTITYDEHIFVSTTIRWEEKRELKKYVYLESCEKNLRTLISQVIVFPSLPLFLTFKKEICFKFNQLKKAHTYTNKKEKSCSNNLLEKVGQTLLFCCFTVERETLTK